MLKQISKGINVIKGVVFHSEDRMPKPEKYSGKAISRFDTPFMVAIKSNMDPPFVKKGWLSGYYGSGVRG